MPTLENMIADTAIVENVKLGENCRVWHCANIYDCEIGSNCTIGSYVEIQGGAKIGDNTIISSHSFICDRVTIEDSVFIGHGVMTINDLDPPSKKRTGKEMGWRPTTIGEGAMIGSNSTLFPVKIGKYAKIGAGSVVTKDVPDYGVVYGNPAKLIKIKNGNSTE